VLCRPIGLVRLSGSRLSPAAVRMVEMQREEMAALPG